MWFNREKEQARQELDALMAENESLRTTILEYEQRLEQSETNLHAAEKLSSTNQVVIKEQLKSNNMLSQISEDLSCNAQQLSREQEENKQLGDIFAQTISAVNQLSSHADNIHQQASRSGESVRELSTTAQSIKQLVSTIQEISDQTNLLALNAAIEAARAGEAGRGFAVVADEVRQLASKAHQASDSIDALVANVIKQTDAIEATVLASRKNSQEIGSCSLQVDRVVKEVVGRSKVMGSVISQNASMVLLNKMKIDHAVWKNRVYSMIEQRNFNQPLIGHTDCDLGHWYLRGEGAANFSQLPGFREIDLPHQKVHSSGAQALQMAKSGEINLAAKHLAEMEEASLAVVTSINRLIANIPR